MRNHEYKPGDWKAVCDICGFEYFASELIEDWRGWRVCPKDRDRRNPQEFVRGKEEVIGVPWARPGDNEGRLTAETASFAITADLTEVVFWVIDTSGITITLPAANHANYSNISINLVIGSDEDSTSDSTLSSTSAIIGSTTLLAGTSARLRNIPSQNTWIREA